MLDRSGRLNKPSNHCQKAFMMILTWQERYHDLEGGSLRVSLVHCTQVILSPVTSPNVGNSTTSVGEGLCSRCVGGGDVTGSIYEMPVGLRSHNAIKI